MTKILQRAIVFPYGHPDGGFDVLWRVDAQRYSTVIDPDLGIFGISGPELQARWYAVEKRTPCGAWIRPQSERRFVNLTANKTWAANTVEEALESFRARRRRQIYILKNQLRRAEEDLALTAQQETNHV